MKPTSMLESFQSLTDDDQVRLLTRLAWELTLVARTYYRPGTEELENPVAVRQVNELQHQIAQHSLAIQEGRDARYPDDLLVEVLRDMPNGNELREQVLCAFDRALRFVRPERTAGLSPVPKA